MSTKAKIRKSDNKCECGELKLYFGKEKLCPVCDELKVMKKSRDALRKNKLKIMGLIK